MMVTKQVIVGLSNTLKLMYQLLVDVILYRVIAGLVKTKKTARRLVYSLLTKTKKSNINQVGFCTEIINF